MVVVGHFSVRLLDAKTKQPFKEHEGPKTNGDIYAEVEPDAEAFIECQVLERGDSAAMNNPSELCYFEYFIDGKELPFYSVLGRGDDPELTGLITRDSDGVETNSSFKFIQPKIDPKCIAHHENKNDDGEIEAPPGMMMGCITVRIFEAVNHGQVAWEDCNINCDEFVQESSKPSLDPSLMLTMKQTKKVLRTTQGATSFSRSARADTSNIQVQAENEVEEEDASESVGAYCDHFVPGKLLQEININYCTALGLIHAGVLPEPPLWHFHRMKHGRPQNDTDDSMTNFTVPFKRVKIQAQYEHGVLISEAKEVDIFDLTACNDDDSNNHIMTNNTKNNKEPASPSGVGSSSPQDCNINKSSTDSVPSLISPQK